MTEGVLRNDPLLFIKFIKMNSVNLVIQRLAAHPFEVFCATGIALGLYKYYKIENIYQENFAHFDR